MAKPLVTHPQVEKALRRLKNMGLKVRVYQAGDREVYIFIDLNSICQLIDRQIKFPNRKVAIEGDYIVVYLWRRL